MDPQTSATRAPAIPPAATRRGGKTDTNDSVADGHAFVMPLMGHEGRSTTIKFARVNAERIRIVPLRPSPVTASPLRQGRDHKAIRALTGAVQVCLLVFTGPSPPFFYVCFS